MSKLFTVIVVATVALQAAPAAADSSRSAYGLWRNPRGTIDVLISPCGAQVCGTVARASPQAEQDAREAGVRNLIGIRLLQDYRQVARSRWEGRVYVPDMGGTFSSHIVLVSPSELRISGCLVGGWLCKSQRWTRL